MPGIREELNGAALARWGRLCLDGLVRHHDEINALNVFPVADADTGTNMLATMRAAVGAAEAVEQAEGDGSSSLMVAGAMARAATAGARGNSGIILSQVLRGVAEAAAAGPLTAETLRGALRRAAVLVRDALSEPVEGTMLTVLEAAADRAEDCAEDTLEAVALAAADGAAKALGDTPSQLNILRAAGVVDAGARGLLVLLDALVTEVTGQLPTRQEYTASGPIPARDMSGSVTVGEAESGSVPAGAGARRTAARTGSSEVIEDDRAGESSGEAIAVVASSADVAQTLEGCAPDEGANGPAPGAHPQYEVMYLLSGSDEHRIAALRESLARLGDSVVVVGDGAGTWSAHVHCADAGAAVEAGLAAGTPSRIRIEGLVTNQLGTSGPADRGILAVAVGPGTARLFEDGGALVLRGAVTTETLLSAIRNMPHREVVVLPNGALPAHELVAVSVAARGGQREVLMLPSGSMVQGLAALALHDAGRTAADDVFAMSEAAAATRWGALRVAAERALTIVGTCEQGDALGLVGNDVVVIDPDLGTAARTLLRRMLGLGGELVTLLLGADVPAGLGAALTEYIAATFPGVEVVTYDGGQSADLVQIGVE
ncbi:DAK2 domain-containing protein [Nocardia sp. BMG51109]|uniref:DAK2 domain-containing protein n=1 Tax=Nocardia sp. BMG51109 TaxID=1056816 RepID=UPI00046628B1|nr:DAK2 domain-containing protein [Nocardia sp. BMG51109]